MDDPPLGQEDRVVGSRDEEGVSGVGRAGSRRGWSSLRRRRRHRLPFRQEGEPSVTGGVRGGRRRERGQWETRDVEPLLSVVSPRPGSPQTGSVCVSTVLSLRPSRRRRLPPVSPPRDYEIRTRGHPRRRRTTGPAPLLADRGRTTLFTQGCSCPLRIVGQG